MSGMDRLTIDDLEYWEEYGDYDAKLMARELLAHRRASQAAPAPSDGLREALETIRDGYGPNHLSKFALAIASAALIRADFSYEDADRAAPAPAQEGDE